MTSRHPAARLRRLLSTLCLAATPLLAATSAAAMPVSAQIDNLPPGLTVQLQPRRCVMGDMNAPQNFMNTPPLPLVETQHTVYESITNVLGQTLLRARIITRYSGQVDVNPDPPPNMGLFSCDSFVHGSDVLRFALVIQGQGGDGAVATREMHLGLTKNRVNPVALRRTLFGTTTLLNPPTQVPRNTRLQLELQHTNPFAVTMTPSSNETTLTPSTHAPSLEFRRTVQLPGLLVPTVQVTRVFVDAQGRKCITAASGSTRCAGSTPLQFGMLVHGGVVLDVASTRAALLAGGSERSVFVLALDSSFAPGDLTLRTSADDRDPIRYLVDGEPTELDLLEWRPGNLPLRVL